MDSKGRIFNMKMYIGKLPQQTPVLEKINMYW